MKNKLYQEVKSLKLDEEEYKNLKKQNIYILIDGIEKFIKHFYHNNDKFNKLIEEFDEKQWDMKFNKGQLYFIRHQHSIGLDI